MDTIPDWPDPIKILASGKGPFGRKPMGAGSVLQNFPPKEHGMTDIMCFRRLVQVYLPKAWRQDACLGGLLGNRAGKSEASYFREEKRQLREGEGNCLPVPIVCVF